MLASLSKSKDKNKNNTCILCFKNIIDIKSYPDICKDLFHYKCLRNYVDKKIEDKEPIICPEIGCQKIFSRIVNKYEYSDEILFQNVILSNDEITCCICFSKYQSPVASSDACSHAFCYECIKKWCTFKHECPMDRTPIKMLLISDYPGGHISFKVDPPAIEQDLNGDGDNDEIGDTACEVCNSGHDEHQLLLCDNCNRGYHIYCLPEPLFTIPDGDWYCDDCRSHNTIIEDTTVVVDRRLPRGLGRVISGLQNRLNRSNTTSNRERIRNSMLSRTRSRIRNDESLIETDSRVGLGLRQRTSSVHGRSLSTRSARSRIIQMESRISSSEFESSFTRSSVTSSESLNTSTESEEPIIPRSRRIQTRNRYIDIRPGSLSSDIDSNTEPSRKKKKFDESSTSSDSDVRESEESEAESSGEEDVDLSPVKKLNMAKSNLSLKLRKSQRAMKISRKIKDDSEVDGDYNDYDDDDYEPTSIDTIKRKRHLTIESNSDDDNLKQKPTTSKISKRADLRKKVCSRVRLRSKKRKITKKSSRTKKSNSKKKKNSTKKKQLTKTNLRLTKRTLQRNKKVKRDKDDNIGLKYTSLQNRLSITSRENNLPWISDNVDDFNIAPVTNNQTNFIRSPHKSNSILSEINESQNNLRTMTLSTIKRLSDGTVVHKPKLTEPVIVKDNVTVSPFKLTMLPSTSNASNNVFTISGASNNTVESLSKIIEAKNLQNVKSILPFKEPKSNAAVICQSIMKPTEIIHKTEVKPVSQRATVHFSMPTSSQSSLEPSTSKGSSEPCSSASLSPEFSTKTKASIYKILLKFYSENKIDKKEFKDLKQRISDKILKKSLDTYKDEKIKKFANRYLEFYFSKRDKHVPN